MKKLNFLFIILIVFPLSAEIGEKIPLWKAVEQGIRMSENYQNHMLDGKIAGMERDLSEKNKLFNIDINANYLFRSQTMTFETPSVSFPGGGYLPGQKIEAGLKHNYDLSLSAFQPLFNGGVLSNRVKLNEMSINLESNRAFMSKIQISSEIKVSFFKFLQLKWKKRSMENLLKQVDLHREKLENHFNEGLVKKSDLLETLSKIEEIKLTESDVERALANEMILFKRLSSYDIENIDDNYREYFYEFTETMNYFERNHPMLSTLTRQMEMLDLQIKIKKGQRLPQLNGFAEIHYGKPGIDFFKKSWSLYFQGGIILKVPVFDWKKLNGEKNILEIRKQKLDNQRQEFVRDVSKNLEQLYTTKVILENKLRSIEKLIVFSGEDAELKSELYSEKQIPNIDYLAALFLKERYLSLKDELIFLIEQVKVNINMIAGNMKEGQ